MVRRSTTWWCAHSVRAIRGRRGIRRRFHLTISGCLGPCALANVILIQFHGQSIWFHSINSPEDVDVIYAYVEEMLAGESYLDPPAALAGRHFQRYMVDTLNHNEHSVERRVELLTGSKLPIGT